VVKDANNCQVTLATVTITQPADLTVTLDGQTNVLCYNGTNGAINVTVAGGVVPVGGYFYTWTGTKLKIFPVSRQVHIILRLRMPITVQ